MAAGKCSAPVATQGMAHCHSSIDSRQICVVGAETVRHGVFFSHASLLTYRVRYACAADEQSLRYVGEAVDGDDSRWAGEFAAPFRWDSWTWLSHAEAGMRARRGAPPAWDREIRVEVSFSAPGLAPVGPFVTTLLVDTDPG